MTRFAVEYIWDNEEETQFFDMDWARPDPETLWEVAEKVVPTGAEIQEVRRNDGKVVVTLEDRERKE